LFVKIHRADRARRREKLLHPLGAQPDFATVPRAGHKFRSGSHSHAFSFSWLKVFLLIGPAPARERFFTYRDKVFLQRAHG
jgi:hypothetical protein